MNSTQHDFISGIGNTPLIKLRAASEITGCNIYEKEWSNRIKKWKEPKIENQTPWQEIYRSNVGQLADGGCLELATAYKRIAKHLPRDNH